MQPRSLGPRYWLITSAIVAGVAFACSSTGGGSGVAGGGGVGAGVGTGGSGANGTGATGAVIGTGGGDPDGSTGPKIGCTPDLQSVVDENGVVKQTCPPDQGCFEGACVGACEAAGKAGGNLGCDFYAPDPPFAGQGWANSQNTLGPCYAVFLANAWSRPVQINVTRNGQNFNVTSFARIPQGNVPNVQYQPVPATGLPPGEVAILFLSHQPGVNNVSSLECPVPPALAQNAAVVGSGRGAAFHVTTDTPVSAYAILPYGGALSFLPSATLLFPSTAYGTNYVTMAPHDQSDPAQPQFPGKVWAHIVGTVDGTQVDVVPQKTLPAGGGVAQAPAGTKTTYTLGAGEILQWLGDANGMIVSADKPVGVFTGTTYLVAPTQTASNGGHDSTHQQIPPVRAPGSEYVAPLITTRPNNLQPESVPHRIVGVVDGTTLTYEPGPPPGAPSVLNAGNTVEFQTQQPFVVRSQDKDHPFLISNYMPGGIQKDPPSRPGCSANPPPLVPPGCVLGDEDWVVVLPPQQFLNRYVFFTDPTYSTTNLVVTRLNTGSGFKDVEVACLGNITGWQPVGSAGTYEVAYVDLMRGGVPVANCGVSSHVAKSDAPFGIVVWGTDWYASYGYPAGGNVRTINDVYVPPVPR